ncbi:hypothetical protein BH10PSE7_BH10PSE7_08840 [soil metagenome]
MNTILKAVIGRAELWPPEDQEELAQIAVEIEMRRKGEYQASSDELVAIDDALADVEAHGFADQADIDALLTKYR